MAQYMMLLHEQPTDFAGLSYDDIEKIIREYVAWRNEAAAQGRLVGGQKLKDEGGKSLKLENGSLRVTDGPFAEAKEIIGGYFTIVADGYEEAVEIARSCPHLTYGGRIELREIEPTTAGD